MPGAVCEVRTYGSVRGKKSEIYFRLLPTRFLIQMLANMGGKLANLKYFTIFTLFNTADIIGGKSVVLPIIILITVAIVLYGIGIYIFSKRDLSV